MHRFRQSFSKVLGQMAQIQIILSNANPPRPLFNVDLYLTFCFSVQMCVDSKNNIEWGGGGEG